LAEDLEGDVGGNAVFLNEAATEIEFDLGGGRETDFDFLEADFHEQFEILEFLLDAHGLGEGLVAVAEIDAAPDRGLGERAVGPLAVGQGDGRERAVFRDGRGLHGESDFEGKGGWTNERQEASRRTVERHRGRDGRFFRPTRDQPLGGQLTIARVRKSKGL